MHLVIGRVLGAAHFNIATKFLMVGTAQCIIEISDTFLSALQSFGFHAPPCFTQPPCFTENARSKSSILLIVLRSTTKGPTRFERKEI